MTDWGSIELFLDSPVVEVGGVAAGRVQWVVRDSDAIGRVEAVELVISYRIDGAGDPEGGVVAGCRIPALPDGHIEGRFELTIPHGFPISYDGTLMRIQYTMSAKLDIRRRRDHSYDYPLIVVPVNGTGTYQTPHPLGFTPAW